MAEQYEPGLQRIFYRSSSFRPGLIVRVELDRSDFDPNTISMQLVEVPGKRGIYYFDYIFQEGTYLANFFENGIERGTQVYLIRSFGTSGGGVVRSYIGPNVIG